MKGMEMMMGAVFKSLGLNADVITASLAEIFRIAQTVDQRIAAIQDAQNAQQDQLDRIEALISGKKASTRNAAPMIEGNASHD